MADEEALAAALREVYMDLCHKNPIVQGGRRGCQALSVNVLAGFEGEDRGIGGQRKQVAGVRVVGEILG